MGLKKTRYRVLQGSKKIYIREYLVGQQLQNLEILLCSVYTNWRRFSLCSVYTDWRRSFCVVVIQIREYLFAQWLYKLKKIFFCVGVIQTREYLFAWWSYRLENIILRSGYTNWRRSFLRSGYIDQRISFCVVVIQTREHLFAQWLYKLEKILQCSGYTDWRRSFCVVVT